MQSIFFYKFIYFIYLFIFGCIGSLLLCAGFSLVVASGGYSSLWSTGYRRAGFSSCGSRALEHRLSSCGAWAQLLHGMWDLPGPGLEPVSPALAGGFLTTAPPGKPPRLFLKVIIITILHIRVYGMCPKLYSENNPSLVCSYCHFLLMATIYRAFMFQVQ